MPKKKNMFRLPSPSNINPPTKGINSLKERICKELVRNGRFGAKKQVVRVISTSGYYNTDDATPSAWMAELLQSPQAISFLREQLNRDFVSQGWRVTWMEQLRCGYAIKMSYNPK